jgi:hypothetical protein
VNGVRDFCTLGIGMRVVITDEAKTDRKTEVSKTICGAISLAQIPTALPWDWTRESILKSRRYRTDRYMARPLTQSELRDVILQSSFHQLQFYLQSAQFPQLILSFNVAFNCSSSNDRVFSKQWNVKAITEKFKTFSLLFFFFGRQQRKLLVRTSDLVVEI